MRSRRAILLTASAVLGIPFVVPFFSPWSAINCRVQEIDLRSGLQRNTTYFYWLPVHRKIRDTSVSLAIGNPPSARGDSHWVRVNTFGPYARNSPHHTYHSALHQTRTLAGLWEEFELDPAARQETARRLLHEWQSSGSDSSADDYLGLLPNTL
jgi:hypothetical protein